MIHHHQMLGREQQFVTQLYRDKVTYLSIYLIYLTTYLSINLPTYLYIYLSINLSHLSTYLSIYLLFTTYLSTYLPIYHLHLSSRHYLFIYHLSTH